MSELLYRASPISWNRVASMTDSLRQQLELENQKFFPIIEVLELVLDQQLGIVRIDVEDNEIMRDMEGFTDPAGEFICFSETVYHQAYQQKPRARWTAAHETGHFFLHTRKPLMRVVGESVRAFECPERQAHQFAAELLMPRRFMRSDMDVHEVMSDFGVSEEAATKRLKFIASLK